MARPKSQDELSMYDRPFRLFEESRKSWNYLVSDKVVYFLESFRFTLNSPEGIAKDYLQRNIWIECHVTFQFRLQTQREAHYIVILEACEPHNTGRKLKRDSRTVDRDSHMVIDVAEFIETPKKVALRGFPTVVRLKRLNDAHCLCGYAPSRLSHAFIVPLFQDGELSMLGIGQSQLCKAPYKLVQRRSKIIKYIAHDKRNRVRNVLNPNSDAAALIFSIVIDDQRARLQFAESLQFLPQDFKVFVRPGGLKIGISQSNAHGRDDNRGG
jgi:hypothetical protein